MEKKNMGFTLLELVIAMAISFLIIGTVASFLYCSTGNYRRTNEEINLQMEAQTILNQLDNLIIEAENVKYDSSTDTLKIKQCEAYYVITLDHSDHTLEFEKVLNGNSPTGDTRQFGRFVESMEVEDTGSGDANSQIKISLVLRSNNNIYEVRDNVILLRNRITPMNAI